MATSPKPRQRSESKEWDDLPRWFRELGPSYRAANPAGVAEMDRAQSQVRDWKGRPAKVSQRCLTGEVGDIESAHAADDRRGGHVHISLDHADDCAARPGQRGRDRAGVRPFNLLGATRVLQSHRARIHRAGHKIKLAITVSIPGVEQRAQFPANRAKRFFITSI